jgi:putative ABC transport system permease protein
MLAYYARLALKNLWSTPGLSALMMLGIGLGIGVCITVLTVYHSMAGNPIWWKNDRLYAVTMDSWPIERPAIPDRPHLPPAQLTYMDATYLFASDIPVGKVIMYPVNAVVSGGADEGRALRARTRVTSADFFSMFDAPFRDGGSWDARADAGPEPVIVLSRVLNEKLFAGENGVGRTIRWNNRSFRVVGVLNDWQPLPRFYDVNTGPFDAPEDAYIPWGWSSALELRTSGTGRCWKRDPIDTFQQLTASECVWLQMWVELPDAEHRDRMLTFIDSYWAEQRKNGRFQRPRNNRLTNVEDWLRDQEVVHDDNRLLVRLAFTFLLVCLINTAGLLLAKFLSAAAHSGVRRALGASRLQIAGQHLVESAVVAAGGAIAGLILAALGLWGLRTLYAVEGEQGGYGSLAQFDAAAGIWAFGLAIVATFVAGLYPAWRIGRVPPTVYLKGQ